MGAGEVAWEVFVGDIAAEDDVGPTCLLHETLKTCPETTFSHEDKTCIGMSLTNSRNGSQQILGAFAPLKATHEQDIPLIIHKLRQRCNLRIEALRVDTIGDDSIVGRKVVRNELVGGIGDGNATYQSAKIATQKRIGRGIRQVGGRGHAGSGKGVKRSNGQSA